MKKPGVFDARIDVRIFVLYAEKAGADLAARASGKLRASLGDAFNITQTVWNAELLMSPKLRALAASEAADSDVVLIASREGNPLPDEVSQWLDLWQERGRPSPAALVALLKRKTIYSPRPVQETLHQFAATAGMDFFCHSEVRKTASRREHSVAGTA